MKCEGWHGSGRLLHGLADGGDLLIGLVTEEFQSEVQVFWRHPIDLGIAAAQTRN